MIERIITFGARQRVVTFVLLALLSALSLWQVPNIRVDTSYDSLMRQKDPARLEYDKVVAQFGSDNTTIVYLRATDLFTRERLAAIDRLTVELQNLDGVTRVESLFTIRNVRGETGDLETGPLLDGVPVDAAGLANARANALRSPLALGTLISGDGTVTAVNVTVASENGDPAFNHAFHKKLDALLQPLRRDFDEIFQVGPPRLNSDIEQAMFADLTVLTPLSTLLILICLVLMMRMWLGAVVPMLSAGLSILWTFGFMGAMGFPLTILTAIVPSLVIVIGCAEDTHMISEYMHGVARKLDRLPAIRYMARKIGVPILINSFTTALGFFTNAISDITLIVQFSYVTGFAMLANLVSTVLVVPLTLSLFGPRTTSATIEDNQRLGKIISRWTDRIVTLTDTHARSIGIGLAAVVAVFVALSFTVVVSNDPLSYFRSGAPIVRDSQTVHRDLSGMQIFYIALTADKPGAFQEPEYLKRVEAVQRHLARTGHFDKTVSLADQVGWVNREMHRGDPARLRVPDENGLIPQYLLFFQREDLSPYITADYRQANILVRHNISASEKLNAVVAGLQAELPKILGEGIAFQITGRGILVNAAAESLFINEVYSLMTLVVIIFLIMSAMFTSFRAGFVSMVPNIIPMVFLFGIMGLFGIPLNPGTATVAAVALGIAVDDTTHFMARYNAERQLHPTHLEALRATLHSEIFPVITTSLALALGFFVLVFSNFTIVLQFGVLAASTMILALFVDLLITPILLGRARLVTLWDMIALKLGPEVLEKSPLFANMRPWQIKKAILLCGIRTCRADETVLARGAKGSHAYLVLSGEVQVHLGSVRRPGREVARFGPGQVFGEIGFLAGVPRTATVIATEPTELMSLERDGLSQALRFHPFIASRLYRNLARILGDRLAAMNRQVIARRPAT